MSQKFRIIIISGLIILGIIVVPSCETTTENGFIEEEEDNSTYDVDANGIPRFVNTNYIQLAKIYRISRFRSAVGHSYSDDFETCRSMKHYLHPRNNLKWSEILITSPVTGTIVQANEGWAGTQVQIKADAYPAFIFIIFHVNLSSPLNPGDTVQAGQNIGTHIGTQTWSDIAVGVHTPNGWKLISYFEVITDPVFAAYMARGVTSRGQLIITKENRDADPLTCNGEDFTSTGNIQDWIVLN